MRALDRLLSCLERMALLCLVLVLFVRAVYGLCDTERYIECAGEVDPPSDTSCPTLKSYYFTFIDECAVPTDCCTQLKAAFQTSSPSATVFRDACSDAQAVIDTCDPSPPPTIAAAHHVGRGWPVLLAGLTVAVVVARTLR